MYNEPAITGGGNFADALTGIVDETGARFANFGFDSSRRPVLTEHAGGANRYIFQSQATLDFRSTAYDAGGRPLSTVDPNGRVTTLTYDARGRLTERNVGGEATSYVYAAAGQLILQAHRRQVGDLLVTLYYQIRRRALIRHVGEDGHPRQ